MEKQKKEKKIILCIDGGGVRGLVPALTLQAIKEAVDERVQHEPDLHDWQFQDACEIIAGTSTGSIIAAGLCKKNPLQPKEFIRIYEDRASEIFPPRKYIPHLLAVPLWSYRYSAKPLEEILKKYLKEDTLGSIPDGKAKLLACAYDLDQRQPRFFFSYWQTTEGQKDRMEREAKYRSNCFDSKEEPSKNFRAMDWKLRDVCRASSAAPLYLPPFDFVEDLEKVQVEETAVYQEMLKYRKAEIERLERKVKKNLEVGELTEVEKAKATIEQLCIVPPEPTAPSKAHEYSFVDGGLFANSPVFHAVAGFIDMNHGIPSNSKMIVISLGTGYSVNSTVPKTFLEHVFPPFLIRWILEIIDISMDGHSHAAHDTFKFAYARDNGLMKYFRFNPKFNKSFALDDAKKESIDYMKKYTKEWLNLPHSKDKIGQVADFIVGKLKENSSKDGDKPKSSEITGPSKQTALASCSVIAAGGTALLMRRWGWRASRIVSTRRGRWF